MLQGLNGGYMKVCQIHVVWLQGAELRLICLLSYSLIYLLSTYKTSTQGQSVTEKKMHRNLCSNVAVSQIFDTRD